MALRLKKDVQKASYYVWFLGAQESKELRGDKVLLSTIPRLIERSRHQENIKVTLQVSHKGLKIIQGSAKHFIPHNAITCSIVKDDIVACVLLLYNPETRCPLHVHAYRLDSELTANNLNDQLQILIKSPENQKRFAELELKLETSLRSIERSKPLSMPTRNSSKHFDVSQRNFDSSLGSDTGTSTRESECSEEQQNSPVERSAHLYDSLAAELRAKLNGNGPPLLLPPRDYDTISRSQGNLTAVDLRRCQNLSIVGKEVKSLKKRGHVSSHGSSGIGSDLAPSPERHEEMSNSSSDDWKHDGPSSGFARKMEKIHLSDEKKSPTRYRDNPPSYIFPKDPAENFRVMQKYKEKSYHRVEEDQPIIVKNQTNYEISKKQYVEPVKHSKEVRKHQSGLMRQQSERYRQATDRIEYTRNDPGKDRSYELEQYDRENLTDRQKYREIVESKKYRNTHGSSPRVELHRLNDYKRDDRDFPSDDHFVRTIQRKSKADKYEPVEPRIDRKTNEYVERNPYRESESLPYRQSIESMMKSPVLKYKSKAAYERRSPSPTNELYLHGQRSGRNYNTPAPPYAKDSSPMSTMKRTSPKDRFQDAKEKFQAMEKIRLKESKPLGARRSEPMRYEKDYRREYSPEPRYPHNHNHWSSEEEEYGPKVPEFRGEVKSRNDTKGIGPAKSLGNLVNIKGYRHSYAEPMNMKYCNRVGLAAIDPY